MMIRGILRPCCRRVIFPIRRYVGNFQVPFEDDLTSINNDDFNLLDFQYYNGSVDIKKAGIQTKDVNKNFNEINKLDKAIIDLNEFTKLKEPMVFVSNLKDPYLNLAIEDFIYNEMPLPSADSSASYNRLMFYRNWACVVIGKNQNPWKEVNLPLLNSLHIPLVRRKSGGGTVVHDLGNINYSFMTTKPKFDRFKFAEIVKDSVNRSPEAKYKLELNDRGDITTVTQPDGINYKVSGSAYKLSKGKSYHHGTMLLNLRLDILGKLLSRDETNLGVVDSMASIDSVKAKVTNLELPYEKFVELVSNGFSDSYCQAESAEETSQNAEYDTETGEYNQNELFNLTDFVRSTSKLARIVTIDESTKLNEYIYKVADELKQWEWKYGSTPRFTHDLYNQQFDFTVKFHIDKGAVVSKMDLTFGPSTDRIISQDKIKGSFEFLEQMIQQRRITYSGSSVSGFVTNDIISDWIGLSVDGTT